MAARGTSDKDAKVRKDGHNGIVKDAFERFFVLFSSALASIVFESQRWILRSAPLNYFPAAKEPTVIQSSL